MKLKDAHKVVSEQNKVTTQNVHHDPVFRQMIRSERKKKDKYRGERRP